VHLCRTCDTIVARPISARWLTGPSPALCARPMAFSTNPPNSVAHRLSPQNPYRPSENQTSAKPFAPLPPSLSNQTHSPSWTHCRPFDPELPCRRLPLSFYAPRPSFLPWFRSSSLSRLVFCWFGSPNPCSPFFIPRLNGFRFARLLDRFHRFPPLVLRV
jgi:hypothetical protein